MTRLLRRLMIFTLAWAAGLAQAAETLTFGVFAYRPKEVLEKRYQPLVDYLMDQVKDTRIELRVLNQDEMERALADNRLDLVFTNPSHYQTLRTRNSLTGALATLISIESGQATQSLGGVIIVRADSGLHAIPDLRGQKIAIPGTKFLGGYQTQAFELLQADIHLPKDAVVQEVKGHDAVVRTILEGKADAGFIRTGIIEEMSAEGKLDPGQLRVINRQNLPGFPYVSSTRLYPEWPVLALPHVKRQTVRRVAAALLALEPDHPAARTAKIGGFSPPADYLPIENLARALRLPPFDQVPTFTLADVWSQYRYALMTAGIALALIAALMLSLAASNRRLAEARRAAEEANVAKSRFLATMSHEIRTPMNGILGMAQLLMMPNLTEDERRDYAQTVLNSGETLLTLLNDILDLSKVEAGKFELGANPFEPSHLLHEIDTLFSESAMRKGLRLSAAWNGPDRCYLGDQVRLRQMLSNIVSNAVKFTAAGSIRIAGREIDSKDGQALLEFSVADTGIGIPEDKQGRLFKPFSQVDSSNTRQFGGTGLGLSIVRSLAEMMGGGVSLESTPGKGSTFRFHIRVATSPAESAQEAAAAAKRKAEPTAVTAGCNVLVVEDNATNRNVVSAMLGKLGAQVRSVENGREAVDAIANGSSLPDLVLMDCQMPVMDGFEATQRIRAWEKEHNRPRLPIVALTAGAFAEDRSHCLDAGMDDFIAKPVDIEALARVIARWTGKHP